MVVVVCAEGPEVVSLLEIAKFSGGIVLGALVVSSFGNLGFSTFFELKLVALSVDSLISQKSMENPTLTTMLCVVNALLENSYK